MRVCIPEVCDYELRRKYEHLRASRALANLDALGRTVDYVAIETAAMRRAAQLWGETRRAGRPTASPDALDGDVIACAQAIVDAGTNGEVVFATTNVEHLGHFLPASQWADIRP